MLRTSVDERPGAVDLAGRNGALSGRTIAAAQAVLAGRRRRLGPYLAFVGPAVIVSIAYIDPGNFATNIQAGAKYGYSLLWVVLLANLIAMLFQALSAKLGIVTGRNLAEMCRLQFPRPVVWAMWAVSEIAAMATDLAEFLGGAIGLSLLFQMPLLVGMVITGIVTYGILMFEGYGFRPIELIIGGMVSSSAFATSSRCSSFRSTGRRPCSTPSNRKSPMPKRCCFRSALSVQPSCRMQSIYIPA